MRELPKISTVGQADGERAIRTVTAAFVTDPVARWAFPEPAVYLETFPAFLRAVAGRAFEHASAHATMDFSGSALWLPPDVSPDEEAIDEIFQHKTPEEIRGDLFGLLEEMGKYHPHDEPTWYLPMIGVDPFYQRRGIGAALLQHQLRQCDEAGIQSYLESTNPANMSLYERHGFRSMGRIQIGSSPPVHPMLRPVGG
jgi:ribosomal protein S18 acetylase RimI-like enzyme